MDGLFDWGKRIHQRQKTVNESRESRLSSLSRFFFRHRLPKERRPMISSSTSLLLFMDDAVVGIAVVGVVVV